MRSEIVKLPPGALQGLKEGVADEMLASAWGARIYCIAAAGLMSSWVGGCRVGHTPPPPSPARFARQRDSGQHAICSQCHLLALEQLIAVHPHTMHTILSHQELGVKTIADLARWKVGVAAVLD